MSTAILSTGSPTMYWRSLARWCFSSGVLAVHLSQRRNICWRLLWVPPSRSFDEFLSLFGWILDDRQSVCHGNARGLPSVYFLGQQVTSSVYPFPLPPIFCTGHHQLSSTYYTVATVLSGDTSVPICPATLVVLYLRLKLWSVAPDLYQPLICTGSHPSNHPLSRSEVCIFTSLLSPCNYSDEIRSVWCRRRSRVFLRRQYHLLCLHGRRDNASPVGIFDVDSTLNRRRNFGDRRKSGEKRKNISTVVEKALKFRQSLKFRRWFDVDISTVVEKANRRRYFDGRRKSVEKRKNISTSKFARWGGIDMSFPRTVWGVNIECLVLFDPSRHLPFWLLDVRSIVHSWVVSAKFNPSIIEVVFESSNAVITVNISLRVTQYLCSAPVRDLLM